MLRVTNNEDFEFLLIAVKFAWMLLFSCFVRALVAGSFTGLFFSQDVLFLMLFGPVLAFGVVFVFT